MALIPQFFLDSVVAIGRDVFQQHTGAEPTHCRQWIGTGFLYGRYKKKKDNGSRIHNIFLVTNKHVIEKQKSILVKFNSLESTSKDYPVNLYEDDTQVWLGHPDPTIDIAVLPVNPRLLKSEKMHLAYFESDNHVFTSSEMQQQGVAEGDNIYVLGFPMGLVEPNYQYVICRHGCLARVRDIYSKHKKSFLIDAPVYPGNSGGPVVLRPEMVAIEGTKSVSKAALIGIVKSYVPYTDVAISPQTNRTRISFEENSGLANVEPVEYIHETIELYLKKYPACAD